MIEAVFLKYGSAFASVVGALVYSIMRPSLEWWQTLAGFVAGASTAVFATPMVVLWLSVNDQGIERGLAFFLGVIGKELIEIALSKEMRRAVLDRARGVVANKGEV